MGTLQTFGTKMHRRGKKVVPNATRLKRRVGVAVVTAVVQSTPHDTGRARFSWNVAMNHPNYSYSYASFTGYGRTGDWLGKLATSRAAILRAGEKDSIYISNALPYIQKLNRGYSAQAPRGYVRMSAILGANLVKRATLLR